MTQHLLITKTDHKTIELAMAQQTRCVYIGKKEYALTAQEYQLLEALANASGKVLSREKLLRDVWQCNYPIKTRTIDVHVQRLRRKLGQTLIETVHGEGYRVYASTPSLLSQVV